MRKKKLRHNIFFFKFNAFISFFKKKIDAFVSINNQANS